MFEHQDVRQFPVLQTAAQACFQYVLQTAGAAVREAGADPRWERAASAGWSLGHGYVMLLLSGRLAMTDGGDELSPAMVPRFFQLPAEALTPAPLLNPVHLLMTEIVNVKRQTESEGTHPSNATSPRRQASPAASRGAVAGTARLGSAKSGASTG
jgi:hypothetical protein